MRTAGAAGTGRRRRFLIEEPRQTSGLNSGLMMLQATAAHLVSDCKALAHPDSIDSIPSSGDQEGHVSMSLNAARHAREIVRNAETVLALEFVCAAQGIALQLADPANKGKQPAAASTAVLALMADAGWTRVTADRVLQPEIQAMLRLVRSGALVGEARRAVV